MNQPNEGMRERFDEKFIGNREMDIVPIQNGKDLRDFIQSEIDLAIAKQRSEIAEVVESFMDIRNMDANTNGGNWYSGGQINDAHLTNRLCKDIISTITKDTKD